MRDPSAYIEGCTGCHEVWEPYLACEGSTDVAYAYHFLVAPACPVHWDAYVKTMEEMKAWGTVSND